MGQYTHLSDEERLYIHHGIRADKKPVQIAEELGRHPSTISREIKRNRFPNSKLYSHDKAAFLNRWRKEAKKMKVSEKNTKMQGELVDLVEELLKKYLSPEQISGYLKRHHNIEVSHETIYRYIYSDKDRKKALKPFLRQGSKRRRKAYGSGARASNIPNRVPICDRPAIVDSKCRIGDWECDTVIGSDKKSVLVTLVERKSLFTLMAVSKRKTAEEVSSTMIKLLKSHAEKVKTLTFDNGTEFTLHEKVAKQLSAKTYFANPYSSWEGINENTNGLIRQFFPKGSDFNQVTKKEVEAVLSLINNRPRKSRDFKSPNEIFNKQFIPLFDEEKVALRG